MAENGAGGEIIGRLQRVAQFLPFSSPEETALALADHIAELLRAAVASRGRASMAVSGGSTPKPLFRALARRTLAWHQVHITLVDERWVNPDHPESNEKLVRENLLRDNAANAHFTGLKTDHPNPFVGRTSCEQQLTGIPRPFDLVILGMGADGHTASFFPGAAQLAKTLDPDSSHLCEALTPPHAPHQRITLTLPVILNAGQRILHITGRDKLKVLDTALSQQDGDAQLPIGSVFTSPSPVLIYWCP